MDKLKMEATKEKMNDNLDSIYRAWVKRAKDCGWRYTSQESTRYCGSREEFEVVYEALYRQAAAEREHGLTREEFAQLYMQEIRK